ncbi:MAG: hypothetical protein HY726_00610 [Candidatus Rokubacteria bacterium]|nr:hypothetical protein [Candidatus Rokubacteria bacterium]
MMTRVLSMVLAVLLFAAPAFAALDTRDEIQAPVRQDEIQAPASPDEIQAPRVTPLFAEVNSSWGRLGASVGG